MTRGPKPTPRVHVASSAELRALRARERAAGEPGTPGRRAFDREEARRFRESLAADRAALRAWRRSS